MMRRTGLAAVALLAAPLSAQQRPATTAAYPTTVRDSAVTPPMDAARALEAEVRVALNDLLANRSIAALQRLQWLASSAPPAPPPVGVAPTTLRGRGDVLFLLAETQYRLGMDSAFRDNAEAVLRSGPARYAPLLHAQLLLSAYRTGDYDRVAELAKSPPRDEARGLASLVGGLAAYQLHNYSEAAAKFAATRAAGPPYAQYADYMDVLTTLRGDTSKAAAAAGLGRLENIAHDATGTFADQVRLTGAQLAYEMDAYDRAIQLANDVNDSSGVAPLALLTKAWAQYKTKDIAGAGQTFAAFADKYPQLPQRDEARLMAAQSLLQLGKTDDAGKLFRQVSDSGRSESRRLNQKSSDAIIALAVALVRARAAGLLYVNDVALGKTLALQEGAGADPQVLATVMTGTTPLLPQVDVARIVSLTDLQTRYRVIDQSLGVRVPRRILFAPPSAGASTSTFAQRAEALLAADLDLALRTQKLRLAERSDDSRIAQLHGLQEAIQRRGDSLTRLGTRVANTDGQFIGLLRQIDTTEANLKVGLVTDVQRMPGGPAWVLSVRADSLRRRGDIAPNVDVEAMVAARTDSLISAFPMFLLRDSVKVRLDSVNVALADSRASIDQANQLFALALATERRDTSSSLAKLRSAQTAAFVHHNTAENDLVAAVSNELTARASELLALLQHDLQAAEFGTATASFFNAIDQRRTPTRGTQGSDTDQGSDQSGSASGDARAKAPGGGAPAKQTGATTSKPPRPSGAGTPPR